MKEQKNGIILGITSDIGMSLFKFLSKNGYDIIGSYRKKNNKFKIDNTRLSYCDFLKNESINSYVNSLPQKHKNNWNFLIFAVGSMEPIGRFKNIDFSKWHDSILVNFVNQLNLLQQLLKFNKLDANKTKTKPTVLFFAGGGTNSAPKNYSAYIVSKIALIKMIEILDAEIDDVNFVILGPGWIKTKIHNQTLDAADLAEENLRITKDHLRDDNFNSMEELNRCVLWILQNSEILSGRNISLKFDNWGTQEMKDFLNSDSNYFKLRRYGN